MIMELFGLMFLLSTGDRVVVRGHLLATGGDTAKYPERNPAAWLLECSADGANWQTVAEIQNGGLPNMNETCRAFLPTAAEISGCTYFRCTVVTTAGTRSTYQLSELWLIVDVVNALNGDVNSDGTLSISDVTAQLNILSGNA